MADKPATELQNGAHIFHFEHGEGPESQFFHAFERSRLHHAWLLCGPQGLGKAIFAFRIARFLMAKSYESRLGQLGVSPDDPDARLISAESHPDLLVVEKEAGKKNISVDLIRELGEFFSKTPSRSAYRICIIDAVDDLNTNSANALLKILEEPPERGILLLVSHSPGKLLATIKSRCRRLSFKPWSDQEVKQFLSGKIDASEEEIERLCIMARGSAGKALRLWHEGALKMDDWAQKCLSESPPRKSELTSLMSEFKASGAKGDGMQKFSLFMTCLLAQIELKALSAPNAKMAKTWSDLWAKFSQVIGETEGINLDRIDYFFTILQDIKAVS